MPSPVRMKAPNSATPALSARAARTWAKANPAVTGTVLGQARALRAGAAEFGAFMRTGHGTGLPAGPDQA